VDYQNFGTFKEIDAGGLQAAFVRVIRNVGGAGCIAIYGHMSKLEKASLKGSWWLRDRTGTVQALQATVPRATISAEVDGMGAG